MNDDQAIELLEQIVRISSVSTEEAELAHWLAAELPRCGFRAHVDAVGNLRASIGRDQQLALRGRARVRTKGTHSGSSTTSAFRQVSGCGVRGGAQALLISNRGRVPWWTSKPVDCNV